MFNFANPKAARRWETVHDRVVSDKKGEPLKQTVEAAVEQSKAEAKLADEPEQPSNAPASPEAVSYTHLTLPTILLV